MQNKPNLLDVQMNVNSILTKDYERNDIFAVPENKANSNPIKANLLDAQMNVSPVITREYKNKSNWKLGENKPNTKPIKANTKPIQTQFLKSQNEIKLLFNKGL